MDSRRNFLKKAAMLSLSSGILGKWTSSFAKPVITNRITPDSMRPTILFQGDSITDAGRNRGSYYPNQTQGMGNGYVYQIVSRLLGEEPEKGYSFYNRGISGNKVFQLADRWEDDCLQLKPDVLSILIGVNDYWHMLNGNYNGTLEIYESDYRKLLDRTLKALPDLKLIICEPFIVEGGTAIDERWEPFHAYRAVAEKIAGDYSATFIPFHGVFNQALKQADASYWCPDGVHPSMAGAHLMAERWLEGFRS